MNHISERIFAVLEAVSRSQSPLTTEMIAQSAGLSRATAYRLVAKLTERAILLREPRGAGFSPGPRLGELALGLMSSRSIHSLRHAILHRLVSKIGQTCNFTTFHEDRVLYIERVEADWPLVLTLRPGSSVPIHCTSSGKIYLSQMLAKDRRRLLFDAPIPTFTDKTVTDPVRLEAELREVRRRRVAFDDGGYLNGFVSVAVPVGSQRHAIIGTVAAHGRIEHFSMQRATEVIPMLRQAAAQLNDAYRALVT